MSLRTIFRAGLIAQMFLLASPAIAQTDVFTPAETRLGLSEAQLRRVFVLALSYFDGQSYVVDFVRRNTCEELEPFTSKDRLPLQTQARLLAQPPAEQYRQRPLFGFPPELREQVRSLIPRQHTPAFKLADGSCMVAEVVEAKPTTTPTLERIRHQIPYMVEQGWLPHPDRIESDPMIRLRTYAEGLRNPAQLAGAPSDFDVNVRLGNGHTLLTRALIEGDQDMARALLARKADPNLCAPRFCPLDLAIRGGPAQSGQSMLTALLAAGADPNQAGDGRNTYLALTAAAGSGDLAAMKVLLAAGARPDGVPSRIPPIMLAAAKGNREAFDLLLASGGNVLVRDQTHPFNGSAYTAVAQSRTADEAFVQYVEQKMLSAAAASGKYQWQGWIEQQGQRIPLKNGDIHLKRAPFRIIVRMDNDAGFLAASSDTDAMQQETRKGNFDTWVLRPVANGAEARLGTPELFVSRAEQDPMMSTHQYWFWNNDDDRRFDSRKPAGAGFEYTKEIRGILLGGTTYNFDTYSGAPVYMVMGTPINLSTFASRMPSAAYVTIKFDRK